MSAELVINVRLDWTADFHYDDHHSLPCRVCATVTKQRDGQLVPCHKSCAEDEIARELLGIGRRRIVDERVPSPAAQLRGGPR
jgi:hypothetical protein